MSLSTLNKWKWHPLTFFQNSRIQQTGEEFAKMQKEMTKPRPQHLVEIDTSNISEILGCVRCGNIPDPHNVMACEDGHYSCGECVFRAENEGNKFERLNPCCDLRNLGKEPPHLLKLLLDNALFRCQNYRKGCKEEMLGYQTFQEHIITCPYTRFYKCRFHECNEQRKSLKDILLHYIEGHDGTVLVVAKGSLIFPIDFKEITTKRLVAILRVNWQHFVFACEVKDDFVFIWIWDLENEVTGVGRSTSVCYNLRFKLVQKLPSERSQELRDFRGKCAFHAIEPSEIVTTGSRLVDGFRMDVESFKKMFVEKTVNGNGKFTVLVHLKKEG